MPTRARLDTPGRLRDVSDAARLKRWSREQSARFDSAVAGIRRAGATPQFYNPTRVGTGARAVKRLITWPGFPRALALRFGADRTRAHRASGCRAAAAFASAPRTSTSSGTSTAMPAAARSRAWT